MNSQLKPTAMNVLTSNSSASSTVLNDLVSRMNAQTGGAMQDEQKAAFSKWLERHSASTASADAVNQSAKALPTQAKAPAVAAQPAAKREVVHSANQAPQQSETQSAKANANRKAEQAANKNGPAKSAQKDKVNAGNKAGDKADEVDAKKGDPDEVNFTTQLGEGSAVVRELQPPADVQRGDPSSMMAWLASLTQSDAKLAVAQADAKEAGLGKSDGRDGTSSSVAALQAFLAGRGDPNAATTALDPNQLALTQGKADKPGFDLGAWQASQAMAQMTLQTSAGAGGDAAIDPFAGLAAVQNAQMGQTLPFEGATGAKHVSETLNTPVTSPQFADELADKVSLFVRTARDDGPMTAELHLNPAEMGPIHVKIALDGQNAHVDFAAAALETRQAIEASLPMLSSALDEVGLSLTGGGVSQQTSQQGFGQSSSQSNDASARLGESRGGRDGVDGMEEPMGRPVNVSRLSQRGGLDLYA